MFKMQSLENCDKFLEKIEFGLEINHRFTKYTNLEGNFSDQILLIGIHKRNTFRFCPIDYDLKQTF